MLWLFSSWEIAIIHNGVYYIKVFLPRTRIELATFLFQLKISRLLLTGLFRRDTNLYYYCAFNGKLLLCDLFTWFVCLIKPVCLLTNQNGDSRVFSNGKAYKHTVFEGICAWFHLTVILWTSIKHF